MPWGSHQILLTLLSRSVGPLLLPSHTRTRALLGRSCRLMPRVRRCRGRAHRRGPRCQDRHGCGLVALHRLHAAHLRARELRGDAEQPGQGAARVHEGGEGRASAEEPRHPPADALGLSGAESGPRSGAEGGRPAARKEPGEKVPPLWKNAATPHHGLAVQVRDMVTRRAHRLADEVFPCTRSSSPSSFHIFDFPVYASFSLLACSSSSLCSSSQRLIFL